LFYALATINRALHLFYALATINRVIRFL